MEHDQRAWLQDITSACADIPQFTAGMSQEQYADNPLVRAAVERKFLVIGETIVRLRDEAPEAAGKISDMHKIIGFRNILVHGYNVVDDATVWSAIQDNLPVLQ